MIIFQEFEDKLSEAKKLVKTLYKRVSDHKERPVAMEALKSTLNHTQYMMKSMRNYSTIAPEGEGPFTSVELITLETLHKGKTTHVILHLITVACTNY